MIIQSETNYNKDKMLGWPWVLVIAIVLFVGGGFIGFFVAQKTMKKKIYEKPPINEGMIKAMYAQVGRKPSEAQIKEMMRKVKEQMH